MSTTSRFFWVRHYDGRTRWRKIRRRCVVGKRRHDQDRCIHTKCEDGVEEYRFEYKPLEGLTIATRGDGAVTQYFYDQQQCLVQIIDPCGGVTTYVKDDTGKVVTEIDPNGNQSEILYDEKDQPYAKRDPHGHVRLLPADPTPHPLSHRLPENPLQWEQGDWPGPPTPTLESPSITGLIPNWVIDKWGSTPSIALPAPVTIRDVHGSNKVPTPRKIGPSDPAYRHG